MVDAGFEQVDVKWFSYIHIRADPNPFDLLGGKAFGC
jgi:hypothetical protein